MAQRLSTSKGVILPPNVISRMARASAPHSQMGDSAWSAAADILNKGWKPFVPASDTSACWDFTKSRGDPLKDLTENGNDLTLTSAVLRAADGEFGWSYDFIGTDDYLITSGDPTSLKIIGELTVEVICKADAITASKTVISKWDTDSNNEGWRITWDGANIEYVITNDGSTDFITQVNDGAAPVSTVLYLAMVYRPSAYVRGYVNGNMVAETTASVPTSLFNSTQNFTIGGLWDDTTLNHDFNGHVYMCRVTGRAMSHREIWNNGGRTW